MCSPHVAGQGRLGLTCITNQGGPASATCYGSTPVGFGTCRRSRLAGTALRITAGCAQPMIRVKARSTSHVAGQDRSGAHVTHPGPLDQAHVAGHDRVALTHITRQGQLGQAHAMGQGRLGLAHGPGLSGFVPVGQGRNRLTLHARAGHAMGQEGCGSTPARHMLRSKKLCLARAAGQPKPRREFLQCRLRHAHWRH